MKKIHLNSSLEVPSSTARSFPNASAIVEIASVKPLLSRSPNLCIRPIVFNSDSIIAFP